MTGTRLRTALVGCGKVGRTHANALKTLAESDFRAVCDSDRNRAEAFAREFGVTAYTGTAEMVQAERIQAVCICTPHPLHAQATIDAASAGAHVLIEKPLAANLADCDRMIEAAKRSGVQLSVVSQRRFFTPIQRMKAAIDSGKLGKPILATTLMLSWRDPSYYLSDPWRGKWSTEGGGVLVNQSPHHLDLLLWMMGEVEEVSAYAANLSHPTVEVEDTSVASLRFRSGALGSVVVSLCQKPGVYTKIHVHGSNGASIGTQTDTGATFIAGVSNIEEPPVTDLWTVPGEEARLGSFIDEDRRKFAQRDDSDYYHRLQIREFLQCCAEGREPLVTATDGRRVVELFRAIYLSNQRRSAVRLPLVEDAALPRL